jgi:hypothetical protein
VEWIEERLKLDAEAACRQIEALLAVRMRALRRDGILVGLSGGLDSAVVAALAVRSVGSDRVALLYLPDHVCCDFVTGGIQPVLRNHVHTIDDRAACLGRLKRSDAFTTDGATIPEKGFSIEDSVMSCGAGNSPVCQIVLQGSSGCRDLVHPGVRKGMRADLMTFIEGSS